MTKSRNPKKTYQGRLSSGTGPPGLPARVGGTLLWALALIGAWALASLHSGQGPLHPVGSVAWDLCGLGAWWLVLLLGLAGWQFWRMGEAAPLAWLAGGGMWLVMATSGLLGLAAATGAGPNLAGPAGVALAKALLQTSGLFMAWVIPAVMALCGLGVMGWAMWPAFQPGQKAAKGQPRPPKPKKTKPNAKKETEKGASGQASPEPESEPEPTPAAKTSGTPRIKQRDASVLAIDPPQQEKLSFSGGRFKLPPLSLLQEPTESVPPDQEESLRHNSRLLEKKLGDFGVKGNVEEVAPGPVVTMYEFKPAPGVKISKVAGLSDDLAMSLRANSIRIVAPIPGKAVIGIEIPNNRRETVYLRELLSAASYQQSPNPLTVGLGKDILGGPVVGDLSKMPHLLIAGATGAGKSVFINSMVLSILYKSTPEQVRLLMVDPKRIELSTYNDIPHLLYPIITEPKQATAGLRWAVQEMERRYELLAAMGVRNIRSFNKRLQKDGPPPALAEEHPDLGPLPYVVIIIDELADLMMVSSKEVEALITRLAQMARAAGIHLVLATQRPSVDVITGLIKANFPARISFKVTSRVDSRTIMDQQGAENLLGLGDLLFSQPGAAGVVRLHGAFVSDGECEQVAAFLKDQAQPEYDESVVEAAEEEPGGAGGADSDVDEHYAEAVALVRQMGSASISGLQRRLRVGYNRAARMIEQMEIDGIVGPSDGSKPRQVIDRD